MGKTPPCADLIIEKKIPRVIIGTVDPHPCVAGKGIEKLKNAGCDVITGILTDECKEINRRFLTFHHKKRPYIILKWAQTANKFVDKIRNIEEQEKPVWITDEIARIAVHKQRSTEGAIFIGTKTALKDNPSLTLRDWYGEQPIRIVTDLNDKFPSHLNVFDGKAKTITISKTDNKSKINSLFVSDKKPSNVIQSLLDFLYREKVLSVIVEGGPNTLQNFIDLNLWDEAHVYTGQLIFKDGIKAPFFDVTNAITLEKFPNSELTIFRNHKE